MSGGKSAVSHKIGPYQLKHEVGHGAFSVVYLAVHTETQQEYACKVIKSETLADAKAMSHFENEIRVLHQMRHPNIVQFLDVRKDEAYFYVFLEYCPNGELFNYIIEKRFLGEPEAKVLMKQFLKGLTYIHRVGAVHRDLKPENLLLDSTGMVKVSDFGFARYVPADNLMSTSCGSTGYASPECLAGKKYDGQKSDMWSVGVILYAMVTGQLPWTGKNHAAVCKQIEKAEYKIPTYLSDPLKDLIKSLINLNPDQRLTCEEVLESEWLKGADTIAFNEDPPCGVSLKYLDNFFNKETSVLKLGAKKTKFESLSCTAFDGKNIDTTLQVLVKDYGAPESSSGTMSRLPSLRPMAQAKVLSAAEMMKRRQIAKIGSKMAIVSPTSDVSTKKQVLMGAARKSRTTGLLPVLSRPRQMSKHSK